MIKAINPRTGKTYTWSVIVPDNILELIELEGLEIIEDLTEKS